MSDTQVLQDLVDTSILLFFSKLQLEASSESKCFSYSEVLIKHIILHDVGCITSEGLGTARNLVVKEHGTTEVSIVSERTTVTQNVKKRGLTSSGRAHDIQRLARHSVSASLLHNHESLSLGIKLNLLLSCAENSNFELNVLPGELDGPPAVLDGALYLHIHLSYWASRHGESSVWKGNILDTVLVLGGHLSTLLLQETRWGTVLSGLGSLVIDVDLLVAEVPLNEGLGKILVLLTHYFN
mmetsp:Transcript_33303/g.24038  ORF Transcript_33303/g.24038 Transcript_33303/m.24038 type:complete len:240 (+) Transcript_33303:1620-2339(+)